jgi:four helix bundle protein
VSRPHYSLQVWQESIKLVTKIYDLTKGFSAEEMYGLTSQMRRSAVSIPSNIAEGAARGSKKEWIHFLRISRGSLCELETQIIICKKLNYIENIDNVVLELQKISGLLGGLIKSLKE